MGSQASTTPIGIVAQIARVVTQAVERITGDRSDAPLMTCMGVQFALQRYGIQSNVMYGQAAWVEVLSDHGLMWAGCWGKHHWFWVTTQYQELVDLSTAVSHRKHAHDRPELQSIYSPPLLWSNEVPAFYRYQPEGIAEIELTLDRDQQHWERLKAVLLAMPLLEGAQAQEPATIDFPNESILVSGRRLLDDNRDSFKHFDRALGISGIPAAPI